MRLQLTDGYYFHFAQLSRMLQFAYENKDKTKISGNEYSDLLRQVVAENDLFIKLIGNYYGISN